ASREHSRPRTIPARPRETSATSCWNPSRSAAEAPEWPWSRSMTVIGPAGQPSAIALPRRSYWRIADSVLLMTCLRVDCRIYSRAVLDRWAAVTFDETVSVSTGTPFPERLRGVQVPASATASPARAWMSSVVTGPGGWAAGADAGVVLEVDEQV